jgi:gamma-glutamyltranspeptidase/glutathione hydrolase
MISASNPFAVRAGLRLLERGGNAVDAALGAAAMLCVAEPMNIGPGGDAFALVGDGDGVAALDSAGPAPLSADPCSPVHSRGPRSVTVPGAVAGWAALSERYGRLGLDTCLADAIDAAESGLPLCARAGELWADGDCPDAFGPPRARVGEVVRLPALAGTLRRIAERGPDAVYSGEIAHAIAQASWLTEEDLAAFAPRWVAPLRAGYRGREVVEMPPPTQGVIALEALRLLDAAEPTPCNIVHAVALALEDGAAHVRDGADVGWLLAAEHVDRRREQVPRPVRPVDSGTSHLCVVDSDRLVVSLIGSLFGHFGSRVVAPGTGILLQSRGAGFAVEGQVRPGRRPYHTIIPAMITRGEEVVAAFGVVGGHIQAQAHVQVVSALLDDALDPQAALARSRFRLEGTAVLLEEDLWPLAAELRARGYEPLCSCDWRRFGCGQAIVVDGDVLLGGADPRMDGYAAGL